MADKAYRNPIEFSKRSRLKSSDELLKQYVEHLLSTGGRIVNKRYIQHPELGMVDMIKVKATIMTECYASCSLCQRLRPSTYHRCLKRK